MVLSGMQWERLAELTEELSSLLESDEISLSAIPIYRRIEKDKLADLRNNLAGLKLLVPILEEELNVLAERAQRSDFPAEVHHLPHARRLIKKWEEILAERE